MRDLFEDLFPTEPLDPVSAARASVRRQLKRRCYDVVSIFPDADGLFAIVLDGRPVRTPARAHLALPTPALAEAVAAEWQAQIDVIDPARMPLTRLANSTIDGVAHALASVSGEIENYLGSDLLFYRAASPAGLVARQAAHWDPILTWAGDVFGARFVLAEGVVHVRQPDVALGAMRAAIPADPWRLAAVHTVTTLTGSGLIALALAAGRLEVDAAWAAAHVDEDWNMELWGRDALALDRRAAREAEMRAAALVLSSL